MKLSAHLRATAAALLLSAQLASAAIPAQYADIPIIQSIASQLEAQGFEIIDIKRTFLGRFKIDAVAPGYEREIVLTAGGGTILRDDWHKTDTAEQGIDSSPEVLNTDNPTEESNPNDSIGDEPESPDTPDGPESNDSAVEIIIDTPDGGTISGPEQETGEESDSNQSSEESDSENESD